MYFVNSVSFIALISLYKWPYFSWNHDNFLHFNFKFLWRFLKCLATRFDDLFDQAIWNLFYVKLKWNLSWHWCWWHRYVGDFMIVTDFRCWWQNHYFGEFFHQYLESVIWSPTSVTNIDVKKSKYDYTCIIEKK